MSDLALLQRFFFSKMGMSRSISIKDLYRLEGKQINLIMIYDTFFSLYSIDRRKNLASHYGIDLFVSSDRFSLF